MEGVHIKPINRTSVHKICSGQVVLTLATAVKELVENSIDAGATIIDVKLKEYGSECIEVIDNGKGVKPCDYQNLTLKHHTSKIEDFSDVPFVSTFGFRGEALSSLCALSNLEIITCHRDSTVGTLLSFDHDGKLLKSIPTPRQVGTTVILKDLFLTLPVRHKEFLRNIRREYGKMIQLLTAYCLISIKKRITCINTLKGKKNTVLSTNSSESLRENICCIFDSKQVNNLIPIAQCLPSEDSLEEYFLSSSVLEKCKIFKLEGYISNSTHGEGRSSTDRQFYFINGRPCDLPKVAKLINEIYHAFNKNQYPFVLLNIVLNEGFADVNVTPDKRQIFISEEKLLLAIIKTTLLKMYEKQPPQMKMNSPNFLWQTSSGNPPSELQLTQSLQKDFQGPSLKRFFSSSQNERKDAFSPPHKSQRKDDTDDAHISETKEYNCVNKNKSLPLEGAIFGSYIFNGSSSNTPETELEKTSHIKIDGCGGLSSNTSEARYEKAIPTQKNYSFNSSPFRKVNFALTLPFREDKITKKVPFKKNENNKFTDLLKLAQRGTHNSVAVLNKGQKRNIKANRETEKVLPYFAKQVLCNKVVNDSEDDYQEVALIVTAQDTVVDEKNSLEGNNKSISGNADAPIHDEPILRKKRYKSIFFSMEMFHKNKDDDDDNFKLKQEKCSFRKFRSKIAPNESQAAEEELKKEINKESFFHMDIIGQFNLGFIIARLNNDLFIIDQHATDEKYNFEMLQKETVLDTQQLLNPQKLNLTAVSETLLMDNLHIFEKNGFHFTINDENAVGNKVQLVSVPVSQNWSFGKEDVDELIFMLSDNPVHMIRPSRVNQMFASRACRKSVMIGTSLTIQIMKKLVSHMGEIEQPWNCPHGRPTIRHLFNLELLKSISENL